MKNTKHKKSQKSDHVIIIGAMKAGTTSMYEYLCTHPSICRCKTKEPDFFVSEREHEVDGESYKDLWKFREKKHKYYLEASTSYTKYPFNERVPERIRKCEINPKFIYMVRDPIERIESQYNFMKISESKKAHDFRDERLVEVSKYFKQMSRFLGVFPDKERYLIVDFENLVESPKHVLKNCEKFLGMKKGFECDKKSAQNETPKHKTDVWISKLGWIKNKVGKLMSEGKRRDIKKFIAKISPETDRREMNLSERKELKKELSEDMNKFKDEFGFDVGKWGF